MLHCKTPAWYLLLFIEDRYAFGNKNNIIDWYGDEVTYTYNEAGFPVSMEYDGDILRSYKYEKK